MPLFTPDVPDLVTYQTEAEFDAATDGYAVLKVNSETDWPTIWQFPFFKGSGSYVGQVVSLANSGGTEIRISQVVTSDRGEVWNRYRYYYPAFDSYDPFSDWEKVPVLRDPTGIVSANPSVPTWDGNWGPYTEIVSDPADVGANGSIARRKSSGRVAVGTPTDDEDAATKLYVDDAVAGAGGMSVYTTEAQLNGAIEGELAMALIDTEVNWPTLWAKIGTPSKVSVRIERHNDGAEVYFTQYLGDSVTRQGYTDAVGVLTWLPWGAIPAIPDEQYGADGYFLRLRKQGSAVYSTWEQALSIANAPPTSATATGTAG